MMRPCSKRATLGSRSHASVSLTCVCVCRGNPREASDAWWKDMERETLASLRNQGVDGIKRWKCQRIGCDAMYEEHNNPDGCCLHHPGAPMFHDGIKEWTCCHRKSHDFSTFLAIPGCRRGKHSQEKPKAMTTTSKVSTNAPTPLPRKLDSTARLEEAPGREGCTRCKQGFFCSDHGQGTLSTTKNVEETIPTCVDPHAWQTCKHPGCGTKFQEIDNHLRACHYHPGPPVFHDRKRGWKCCEVYVDTFDDFLSIPPCTWGKHGTS